MKTKSLVLALMVATVSVCPAGWVNPSQRGLSFQTYTSEDPIRGNNSGTIVTNGNSYQFAGTITG